MSPSDGTRPQWSTGLSLTTSPSDGFTLVLEIGQMMGPARDTAELLGKRLRHRKVVDRASFFCSDAGAIYLFLSPARDEPSSEVMGEGWWFCWTGVIRDDAYSGFFMSWQSGAWHRGRRG